MKQSRILIINPPHTAIGSRIPDDHLPPLGLLSIGGPLLDAGFNVELLDAEFGPMPLKSIVAVATSNPPDFILMGHSGSSSAHRTIAQLAALLKLVLPNSRIIYGGVFPTYHWQDILQEHSDIDFIVRGEGERTSTELISTLHEGGDPAAVTGIAYRKDGAIVATPQAQMIMDLDSFRVGWELIDFSQYSYWGGKRAVVAQFSRGCPYLCNYCGQRGFWSQYRHRDPVKFARELADLHRHHGVDLINFADELPTGPRKAWRTFLEALIKEDVPLLLVGSTRCSDIVRDADILHLYKKAGFIRFLLGIETYDENTLRDIRKGGSVSEDQQAIRLLRQHGILSMATYVVGFSEEGHRDFYRSLKHLLKYDPDQIQLLYATPHRWTPFYDQIAHRELVQLDTRKWDYKHQVIHNPHLPPWLILLWVKAIEVILQIRPRALKRLLFSSDRDIAHAMRWYTKMGRRVWCKEIWDFFTQDRPKRTGVTLREYYGESLSATEYALKRPKKSARITVAG